MPLKDYSDLVTVIVSPLLTIMATMVGWGIVVRDSRASSNRTEATELLNIIVSTTVELNRRSASFLLDTPNSRSNHQAWVASVSVDIASLRARASILKDLYAISIPDEFFYTLRKTFTLDAEKYQDYDQAQTFQKISGQTTSVSRTLSGIYNLYPSKKRTVS
jgi:hypothetical protein